MVHIFQNPGILVLAMAWFRGSTSFHLLDLLLSPGLHFQAITTHFVSGRPRSLELQSHTLSGSSPLAGESSFLLAQAKKGLEVHIDLVDVTSHL